MTIKKKLIGYGYTDSNGVATLDYNENGTEISTLAPTGSSGYIGKGVGSVQLEAGLHSSEAVVSGTYPVLDTIFYDKGTSSEHNEWYGNYESATNFSRLEDCTFLEYSQSLNRFQITDTLSKDVPIAFEFKYHPTPTLADDYIIVQGNSQYARTLTNFGLGSSECDVKIEIKDLKMSCYLNNSSTPFFKDLSIASYVSTNFNLRFGLNANSDGIKVSDIKVYPI